MTAGPQSLWSCWLRTQGKRISRREWRIEGDRAIMRSEERMGIEALAQAAAEELGAEVEIKDDMCYLTVTAYVDDGEDEYNEVVSVYGGEEMGGIYVRNTFGYVDDDTDFRGLLGVAADECYARVYLEEDDEGEYAVIEAGVPLEGLTAERL